MNSNNGLLTFKLRGIRRSQNLIGTLFEHLASKQWLEVTVHILKCKKNGELLLTHLFAEANNFVMQSLVQQTEFLGQSIAD